MTPKKTATVFVKGADQDKITGDVTQVLAKYDSFVLVKATDEQIAALKSKGLTVHLQNLDTINVGTTTIDTTKPRYDDQGVIQPHPACTHTNVPGPRKHHFIL